MFYGNIVWFWRGVCRLRLNLFLPLTPQSLTAMERFGGGVLLSSHPPCFSHFSTELGKETLFRLRDYDHKN